MASDAAAVSMLIFLKKRCAFFGAAMKDTTSPSAKPNEPFGMCSSPSRSTAQINTLVSRSESCMMECPTSGESPVRRNLTNSAWLRAKELMLSAPGRRSSRAISRAASSSGLMIMDSPSFCRM